MSATGELVAEHGGVKLALRILAKMCDRLEAGKGVPAGHLEEMLDFLKVFVDTCHHGKEEQHLFPAMEAAGVPREGGPIGRMLLDHEEGRALIRSMTAAERRYAAGEAGAGSDFAAAARGYAILLLAHIDREDHVLYPMAEARLSPETMEALETAFEAVEEEVVGRGRHEAFHAMLERLATEYGA
jgi:hemerythrin-like domain-containing protein